MFKKKCMTFKLMIVLLVMTLLIGQTYVGSFGADSQTITDFLKINKTITSQDGTSKDKYYLGELVKIKYTITGGEITIKKPKEIALVIDLTGSMTEQAGNMSKIRALKSVLPAFLDQWTDKGVKICIVTFGPYGTLDTDLMEATAQNISNLKNTVSGWPETINNLRYGTNLGDGLRIAYHKLKTGDQYAGKFIVALTDGKPNVYTYEKNNQGTVPPPTGDISKVYFGKDTVDGKNLLNSNFDDSKEDGKNYAADIMKKIKEDQQTPFKNFLIGFGIGDKEKGTMNFIGQNGPVDRIESNNPNSDFFYRPTTASELDGVFKQIQKAIANEVRFSTANLIDTIADGLSLSDENFTGIPNDILNMANKSQISTMNPGMLTMDLDLRLVPKENDPDTYVLKKNPIEFEITFRVTKTGEITLPPPNGQFIFPNPVKKGESIVLSPTTSEAKLQAKQTVNSIIIPPKVVFAGSNESTRITAIINPKTGLDADDRYVKEWKLPPITNPNIPEIISIDDEIKNDNTVKITVKGNNYGIRTINATSSGYAFGGSEKVTGTGSVISILPQINNITMKLAETKEVTLSLSDVQKEDLKNGIKTAMMDYYYNKGYFSDETTGDTFNGSTYRIYPKDSSALYLGYKSFNFNPDPEQMETTPVIIGDSNTFTETNGSWIIHPKIKDGIKYYRISNNGEIPGFLTSSPNGIAVYYATKEIIPDPETNTYTSADEDKQLWKIDLMEDGNYKITSKRTGKSLRFKNGSTDMTSDLYSGQPSQRWNIVKQTVPNSPTTTVDIDTVINSIEFESDPITGKPLASADEPNTVKIAFGSDNAKLKITGIKPTVLNSRKLDDGKVTITAPIVYKNIDGTVSKMSLTFDAIINDFIDLN